MGKKLSVFITQNLKYATQATKAAAKANSMLGMVKNVHFFTHMDKNMFLPLYETLIRAYMEFTVEALSPYL